MDLDIDLNKKKRIGYYYDDEIGIYKFKKGHPMRPFRVHMTDTLI